jgi:acetyl esterase/lipase
MNSSRSSISQLSKDPNFSALLNHGYTVFTVLHGSQPKFALQEIVKDLPRAVRYIRYHSKRFGIDENKLGVTGRSSGGQLALFLATAAKGF